MCACGCGNPVRKARYPSKQPRFINGHQHRGENNGNYRGGKEQRVCPICSVSFSVYPSSSQVTCGEDRCYRLWQGIQMSSRGQNKEIVYCDQCGAELQRYPSQVHDHNFCNRFCQAEHHSALISGVNNGRWEGGRWKYLQAQARIRDNHRCVVCGFGFVTDVHHILAKANGGEDDIENLITLCPNHHRMAHEGLIDVSSFKRTDWHPEDTPNGSDSVTVPAQGAAYCAESGEASQLARCGASVAQDDIGNGDSC